MFPRKMPNFAAKTRFISRKPVYSDQFCLPLSQPKGRNRPIYDGVLTSFKTKLTVVFFASQEVLPLRGEMLTVVTAEETQQIRVNDSYEVDIMALLPISINITLPGDVIYSFTAYRPGRLHVNLSLEDAKKIARALERKKSLAWFFVYENLSTSWWAVF